MLEAESTQGKCNQASRQDPSPHPIEERMDRIGRTRGGKETINTTSHNHPGPNGGKYKVTTVCKEVQTTSDQETRTGKGSCRPSTSYQCLDKTTSAVDDGVSCSDVSKPVPPRTIGQARPTSRQATSDAPRERGTNRRCTGDHTDSTHRCNIPVKEDFCREHSSSTSTQEDNGGSHGCYQHPHPVEDKVSYNGPFQGHRSFSHTVCPTSNGPFQGHQGSSHTLCSTSNGPFQDHSCSRSDNGPFQGHSGSRPDNGPFQGHRGSHTVCVKKGPFQDPSCSRSDNGPFQGHSGSRPNNGPFQAHRGSHTVCVKKGPFQDQSCSRSDNGPFQGHRGSQSVLPDNGPFQGNRGSHPDNSHFQGHRGSQSVRVDNVPFQGNRGTQSVCSDNGPFQGHHVCTTVKPVTNTLISPSIRTVINIIVCNITCEHTCNTMYIILDILRYQNTN